MQVVVKKFFVQVISDDETIILWDIYGYIKFYARIPFFFLFYSGCMLVSNIVFDV